MVTTFSRVLDYRTYCFVNKIGTISLGESAGLYRFKEKVDGLNPMLLPFSGEPVIGLISFLETITETPVTTEYSAAIFSSVLAYHFPHDAQDVHKEQIISVTEDPEEEAFGLSSSFTWSHIVDASLSIFLTDYVLQDA